MKHYYDSVRNTLGTPVVNASVQINVTGGGGLATIYSDDGLTIKANPTFTNGLGAFDFYVADGRYDIQISGSQISTVVQTNVEISDVTEQQQSKGDLTWNVGNIVVNALTATTVTSGTVTATGLTSGNCVQVGTGGLLTSTAGPCGLASGNLTGSATAGQGTFWNGTSTVTGSPNWTYSSSSGHAVTQGANASDALFMSRFVDSGSTGNFLHFQNAAKSSDIFSLNVLGQAVLTGATTPQFTIAQAGGGSTTDAIKISSTVLSTVDARIGIGSFGSTGLGIGTTSLASTPVDFYSGSTHQLSVQNGFIIPTSAANPAGTGTVRLAASDSIGFRNNANSADLLVQPRSNIGGNVPVDSLNLQGFNSFLAGSFSSGSTTTAATGLYRLASTEGISWRNNGNSADVVLAKNTSDNLTFPNSIVLGSLTSGNCVQASTGGLLTTTAAACGTSSGTITATGTPASGQGTFWSGATSVTGSANWTYAAGSGHSVTQGANAVDAVFVNRFTDTSPTGNFLHFQNNAKNSDIFTVGVTGTVVSANTFNGPAFISTSANPAGSGVLRLATGDAIGWRNGGNTADANLSLAAATGNIPANTLTHNSNMAGWWATFLAANGGNGVAASGDVRLVDGGSISWRNHANSADLVGITKQGAASGNVPADTFIVGNATGLITLFAGDGGSAQANSGFIRMTTGDSVAWRNNANTNDQTLNKDTSDNIRWNTNILLDARSTGSCSAGNFVTAVNTNTAPTCAAPSGVTEAVVVSGSLATQNGVCSTTNNGSNICQIFILANAHTLTRLVAYTDQAPSGCSTNAVIGLRDLTAASNVSTLTPTSTGVLDSGAISVSMTAGHTFGLGNITQASGCSTFVVTAVSATYT